MCTTPKPAIQGFLFTKAGPQFLEAARQMDKTDFSVERLQQTGSLGVLQEQPLHFDTSQNAIAIGRLLVKAADNTVFDITAYITPPAFHSKNDFQELAGKIFRTITAGKRRLALRKREETITAYDEKKKFIFTLPAGYFISKTVSHDFDVIRIKKIRDIADTSWSGITIYSAAIPPFLVLVVVSSLPVIILKTDPNGSRADAVSKYPLPSL